VRNIAPNCPHKTIKYGNAGGAVKTDKANVDPSAKREFKPMVSWRYSEPKDIIKAHMD
jgi:hypothetical protein